MWRETVAAVAMSVLAVGAAQAEEGCCGMDLVRVECFPELGTMEIMSLANSTISMAAMITSLFR